MYSSSSNIAIGLGLLAPASSYEKIEKGGSPIEKEKQNGRAAETESLGYQPCPGDWIVGVGALFVIGFSALGSCAADCEPNMEANVFSSGCGIGYIPIAISTSDNPSDQMSL